MPFRVWQDARILDLGKSEDSSAMDASIHAALASTHTPERVEIGGCARWPVLADREDQAGFVGRRVSASPPLPRALESSIATL
jgi:hypothetical protein